LNPAACPVLNKVFMNKCYCSFFSDVDIEDINIEKVSLHLVYKGICDKNILHILTIEKKNR
jgi:hypothetical protein